MFFINLNLSSDISNPSIYMDYTGNVYDVFSSYFINNIKSLPKEGSHLVLDEDKRADLLSYNIYKTTRFWWLLLLYNDKVCPFDIHSGEYIDYPSINDIEDMYLRLRNIQSENPVILKTCI